MLCGALFIKLGNRISLKFSGEGGGGGKGPWLQEFLGVEYDDEEG